VSEELSQERGGNAARTTMRKAFHSSVLEVQRTIADRILVIEHYWALQRILRRLLSSEGYEVDVTGSGIDCLEMLHRNQPSAVILDLQYPESSWFELCEKIMHLLPNLPLVVLTSSTDPADEARLAEMGADNCLTMPFSSQELLDRMRTLMRHEPRFGSDEPRVSKPDPLRGARCELWPRRSPYLQLW
jgi:DNA-binding response OmpR family regulator